MNTILISGVWFIWVSATGWLGNTTKAEQNDPTPTTAGLAVSYRTAKGQGGVPYRGGQWGGQWAAHSTRAWGAAQPPPPDVPAAAGGAASLGNTYSDDDPKGCHVN